MNWFVSEFPLHLMGPDSWRVAFSVRIPTDLHSNVIYRQSLSSEEKFANPLENSYDALFAGDWESFGGSTYNNEKSHFP